MYENVMATNSSVLWLSPFPRFQHFAAVSLVNFDLTLPFYNITFDEKKFPVLF